MRGRTFAYTFEGGKTRKVGVEERNANGKNLKLRWGYEYTVRDAATGRRRSISKAGFSGKREAEKALGEALGELNKRGGRAPRRPSDAPIAAYVDTWLTAVSHNLKPTTAENYRQLARSYVVRHIGALRLREVEHKHLTDLYATLEAGGGRGGRPLSSLTVHHVHTMLSTMFEYAVEAGDLNENPCRRIPRDAKRRQPKRNADKLRYWTPAQAAQFVRATEGDRLHALYVVALNLGLRRGELAGLQWRDLDLHKDGGTVTIARQLSTVGYEVVEQTPKTGTSATTITIDASLAAVLREHRKAQAAEQLAWAGAGAWQGDGRGWVFTTEDGRPFHPQRIAKLLQGAAERAGVPWVGLHGLRHTCAVIALQAGTPQKIVTELLRHSSTAITADLYQHVTPSMMQGVVSVIGDALRKASAE